MIHKRTLMSSIAVVGAVALLGGCASGGSAGGGDSSDGSDPWADVEPITLSIADIDSEAGAGVQAAIAWYEKVEELSGGKITFEPYWSATLVQPTTMLTSIESGLADISFVNPNWIPDQLPVALWEGQVDELALPDAFPLNMFASQSANVEGLYADGPQRDELDGYNVVPLLGHPFSQAIQMLCAKPVGTVDEAQGTTVRLGGEPWFSAYSEMGMEPITLAYTEMYEAYQRGVIDCVGAIPTSFLSTDLLTLGKYLTLPDSGASNLGAFWGINKDVWEGLPLVAKQAFFEAMPEAYVTYAKATLDLSKELLEVAEENDVEITDSTDLSEWLEKRRETTAADALEGKAPDGIDDPTAFIEAQQARVDEQAAWAEEALGLPAETTPEETIAIYEQGSDAIDWDAYREHIAELLAPYVPTE